MLWQVITFATDCIALISCCWQIPQSHGSGFGLNNLLKFDWLNWFLVNSPNCFHWLFCSRDLIATWFGWDLLEASIFIGLGTFIDLFLCLHFENWVCLLFTCSFCEFRLCFWCNYLVYGQQLLLFKVNT